MLALVHDESLARICTDLDATTRAVAGTALHTRARVRSGAGREFASTSTGASSARSACRFRGMTSARWSRSSTSSARSGSTRTSSGGGWPMCPDHPNHPLRADLDRDGRATWFCPRGRPVAPVGSLGAVGG